MPSVDANLGLLTAPTACKTLGKRLRGRARSSPWPRGCRARDVGPLLFHLKGDTWVRSCIEGRLWTEKQGISDWVARAQLHWDAMRLPPECSQDAGQLWLAVARCGVSACFCWRADERYFFEIGSSLFLFLNPGEGQLMVRHLVCLQNPLKAVCAFPGRSRGLRADACALSTETPCAPSGTAPRLRQWRVSPASVT